MKATTNEKNGGIIPKVISTTSNPKCLIHTFVQGNLDYLPELLIQSNVKLKILREIRYSSH